MVPLFIPTELWFLTWISEVWGSDRLRRLSEFLGRSKMWVKGGQAPAGFGSWDSNGRDVSADLSHENRSHVMWNDRIALAQSLRTTWVTLTRFQITKLHNVTLSKAWLSPVTWVKIFTRRINKAKAETPSILQKFPNADPQATIILHYWQIHIDAVAYVVFLRPSPSTWAV